MRRVLTLLPLFVLLAVPAWGQGKITVAANADIAPLIQEAAHSLKPSIALWRIHVLDRIQWKQWARYTRHQDIQAFSLLGADTTYIRQDFISTHTEGQIIQVLGHELKHLECNCALGEK